MAKYVYKITESRSSLAERYRTQLFYAKIENIKKTYLTVK